MRAVIAGVLLAACLAAPAADPKPADGWIDLMRPDVWKKFDPGWIATDMTQGVQDNPAFKEKVLPRVPMRRWGEPADFGGIAVYLASDASKYHTGDTFVIDGGYLVF